MTKKIGLYAGAFDPINEADLEFGRRALGLGLDRLFFLAEPRPFAKQGIKSLTHRQHMVWLAVSRYSKFGDIRLSPSTDHLRAALPQLISRFGAIRLYFLLGADAAARLAAWPAADLFGDEGPPPSFIVGMSPSRRRGLPRVLLKVFRGRISFVPVPGQPNATAIRRSIKQTGQSEGLPTPVADYIARQGLYRPRPSQGSF